MHSDLIDDKFSVLKTEFVKDFLSWLNGVSHYFTQLVNAMQQQQLLLKLQQTNKKKCKNKRNTKQR